jgi:hypothetical protein
MLIFNKANKEPKTIACKTFRSQVLANSQALRPINFGQLLLANSGKECPANQRTFCRQPKLQGEL